MYYLNGNVDPFPVPTTGYSPCNTIVIGFMYTYDVAQALPSQSGFAGLQTTVSSTPWAQFACNLFALSNGGPNPYSLPSQLQQNLVAWKAVDPQHRKVLIGLGGATAAPNYGVWAQGTNTDAVAAGIAQFVNSVQFPLDGVDIDFEDSAALAVPGSAGSYTPPYDAITMLVNLTVALRNNSSLPAGFLISHAPQTPYLVVQPRAQPYVGSYLVILAMLQQKGVAIDFLNIQAYNNPSYQGCPFNGSFMATLLAGQTLPTYVTGPSPTFPVQVNPLTADQALLGQQLSAPDPIVPWCGDSAAVGTYGLMFWIQDAVVGRTATACVMPQWFSTTGGTPPGPPSPPSSSSSSALPSPPSSSSSSALPTPSSSSSSALPMSAYTNAESAFLVFMLGGMTVLLLGTFIAVVCIAARVYRR